jgi:hypothetical protein
MSEGVTPRSVVEMATRVHRSKKLAYYAAAQQLRISCHTPRKLEAGDTPGSFIPQRVVDEAFEVFRQQRIAQIRAEMEQLEAQS